MGNHFFINVAACVRVDVGYEYRGSVYGSSITQKEINAVLLQLGTIVIITRPSEIWKEL